MEISNFGYSLTSPWWTHVTYIFAHASILHLIINLIGFISIFKFLSKIESKMYLLVFSFSAAVIMSFFTEKELPTVGMSGVVYYLIGVFTALVFYGRIAYKSWFSYTVFLFALTLSLLISYFNKTSNFELHLSCFVVGVNTENLKYSIKLYGGK